ncbi:MAG: putative colanic acid biosynthesis acetyltransferase [Sulfuritalea sp.]|nr:putative colanic acid biosynthesis acetyltransferase [Sulfuritalea sp.]
MPHKLKRQNLDFTNRMLRSVWNLVWVVFFRPTPRNFHAWRRFLLRLFGAKIARSAHIYPTVRIWAPWNLEMQEGSGIGEYVDVYSVDKIVLLKNSAVSQYSFLCTATHDYRKLDLPLLTAPIVLGESSWITADVFVGPGVTIGAGCVVLARSTITRDTDDWKVYGGNPAMFIRDRILE